jgi:hypothetical protein
MSDHQETLAQVVKRIEVSFDKVKQYSEKTDQFRISAGKQFIELKVRIEAGEAGKGVKWWAWYAANFKNRTRRDAQRVMALARSDDPGAAAEEERAKNRAAVAAHRKRVGDAGPRPGGTTYSKSQEYRLTEDDYAVQIVRDVEAEIANLENVVDNPNLLRELTLQKLALAFKDGEGVERSAAAIESSPEPAPAKKRGRPPGSKNKPKEAPAPEPEESPKPAPTGNDVDTEATAEKRKAAAAAAEAALVAPDDGSIPGFLRRDPPEQPVQP